MFNIIVPHFNLTTYGTVTFYQYRLFNNITVHHVNSVARKPRKRFPSPTQLGLASGPLASLTHKTDMQEAKVVEYVFVWRGSV